MINRLKILAHNIKVLIRTTSACLAGAFFLKLALLWITIQLASN